MVKFKEIYEKIMNTKGLVIILIIGIALLILPTSSPSAKDKQQNEEPIQTVNLNEYKKDLEKNLSSMLSSVEGADNVSVMITFTDYGRYVYSKEEQSEKSETVLKGTNKPVLKASSSGGEEPVLIKAELPKISGVLVTAEGAQNSAVKENIKSAVKAVLDVSSNNISVLPK